MKKSNWLQLTTLCFILSLTAACGGKNSSGGNDKKQYSLYSAGDNSILGENYYWATEVQRDTAIRTFNKLIEWRNRTESVSLLSPGFTKGIPASQDNWSNANCKEWDLWIINPKLCWGSTTNTQVQFLETPAQHCTRIENGKILVSRKVDTVIPYNAQYCSQNAEYREYRIQDNQEISKILSLNNKNWFIYDIVESNGIISIVVGSKAVPAQFGYVIDTRIHSLYNPVVMQDIPANKTTQTLIPGFNF